MTRAIVLAGGLGTRLKSAVPDVPKPMAPVNQRPFLEYLLDYWIDQGIEHFILSVGYLHDRIIQHFGPRYKTANLEYAIESAPLGTGGGFLLAAEKLRDGDPFLLLNGDTYFAVDFKKLSDYFYASNADWAFSLFHTRDTVRYLSIDVAVNGKVNALKAPPSQSSALANGGVYMVHPRALEATVPTRLSLEEDLLPRALAKGKRLFGFEFSGAFIDIGVPDDYQRAGHIISAGESLCSMPKN